LAVMLASRPRPSQCLILLLNFLLITASIAPQAGPLGSDEEALPVLLPRGTCRAR
jgi:hypothetical protein